MHMQLAPRPGNSHSLESGFGGGSTYPNACYVGSPRNTSRGTCHINALECKRTQAAGNEPVNRKRTFHVIRGYVEIVDKLLAIATCEFGVVYGSRDKVSPDTRWRVILIIQEGFQPSAVG